RKLADSTNGAIAGELRQISQKLEAETAEQRLTQQRLVDGCFGLAAIGQMTSTLLSFLPDEIDHLRAHLKTMRESSNGKTDGHDREDRLSEVLMSMGDRVGQVQAASGGTDRRRAIDLGAELESFEGYIRHWLGRQEIRLEVKYPPDEVLRTEMRPETLHSLLN